MKKLDREWFASVFTPEHVNTLQRNYVLNRFQRIGIPVIVPIIRVASAANVPSPIQTFTYSYRGRLP